MENDNKECVCLNAETRTKENLKMLDEIDFTKYFAKSPGSEGISMLMSRIENQYRDTNFVDNDIMQGYVFNWVDQFDFVEYLKKRYPEKFISFEVTETHYYIEF